MSRRTRLRLVLLISLCLAAITIAQPALACSVCFGDPNSSMTHGAQAGVLVLLGVVVGLLSLIASLLFFWMRRAADIEAQRNQVGDASGA